jgi:DNA (cytosine-5)-methyltransferase 1
MAHRAGGGYEKPAALSPFLTEHANATSQRVFPADEPLRTQVAQVKGGHFSLVAPTLVQTGYGERAGQEPRALDIGKPLGTVVAGGVKHALVAAHITKFRANSIGSAIDEPLHTVTAGGNMARPAGAAHAMGLVSACLEQANGGFYDGDGRGVDAPLSTICTSGANQRLIWAYLVKYYGNERDGVSLGEPMHTVPTKDRMGLVEVAQVAPDIIGPELRARAKAVADFLHEHLPEQFPEPADMVLLGGYVLADITLRMLVPRELARAQGFDNSYILERGLFETAPGSGQYAWRPITKTDQVRLIGNSVCPDMAAAEVANDLADVVALYAREAA